MLKTLRFGNNRKNYFLLFFIAFESFLLMKDSSNYLKKNKCVILVCGRVKNNISVISSLLNLQSKKAKDEFHKNLIEECKIKIDAISSIHQITYKNNSYSEVDIVALIDTLINELIGFYKNDNQEIMIDWFVEEDYHTAK